MRAKKITLITKISKKNIFAQLLAVKPRLYFFWNADPKLHSGKSIISAIEL